jgi:hypothetical protein
LGVEWPKGGKMKEKVEETWLKRASKWSIVETFKA